MFTHFHVLLSAKDSKDGHRLHCTNVFIYLNEMHVSKKYIGRFNSCQCLRLGERNAVKSPQTLIVQLGPSGVVGSHRVLTQAECTI